jgi:endonuclease YncB( thermonuclease family)
MAAGAVLACVIVGVSDGDSLSARCEGIADAGAQTLKIRLAEIDAPEKTQPFGATSKAHLATLCFGRAAQVRAQAVDRYGRTVARVWCDGVDANAEQVRVGLAWAYERYLKDERLRVVQHAAREAQRGLWADVRPVPPWEWRRVRREGVSVGG